MKKKVLFIQLKGNSFGGVWQVINTISQKLIEFDYDVNIVSLRKNKGVDTFKYHPQIKMSTINEIDIWEDNYTGREIIEDVKNIHIINAFKKTLVRLKHKKSIIKDKQKLKKYIYEYNPDYIIVAHYELLTMIPKEYLSKTINHHHTTFGIIKNHRATIKTLKKYKDKIKFLWLTKSTMEKAKEYGFKNSVQIYNPNRIKTDETANISKNKKLITIARLSKEKRIDLMVEIVKEVFKDKKYKDWNFEIFGKGPEEDNVIKAIDNHKQIKLMGLTNDPQKEQLSSSINLCTSEFEGFCLSIIEANECGVPSIAFNFGEPTEEIIKPSTGIVVKNKSEYIKKLKELMDNQEKIKEMAKNAKEHAKQFQIENIIKEWIKLFNEIDKERNNNRNV